MNIYIETISYNCLFRKKISSVIYQISKLSESAYFLSYEIIKGGILQFKFKLILKIRYLAYDKYTYYFILLLCSKIDKIMKIIIINLILID